MTLFNEERRLPLSFGIALYTDPDRGDATIDGLFIVPGRELESTHFLIGQERGAAAAPWPEVKKRLEHETPGLRSFRDQHSAFVKALLQNTRGRGAVAESEQWLRALRLGAQFRGVQDPNQFVRDHVLPDDTLDLPTPREDARRYAELRRTIDDLEDKEQRLQVVQTDFATWSEKDSEARRGYALAAMARREGVRRQVETGEAAIAGYRQDENSLAARAEQTRERVETARRRVEDARRAFDADPTSGHLEMAKARRLSAQAAPQQANAALSAIRKTFADAARCLADAEHAGVGGSSPLRTRFAAAADLDAPADLWPRGIQAVEAARALAPAMETLAAEMDATLGTVSSHQAEAQTKLTDAIDRLETARAGGPVLGKEATRLIHALRAERMDPIPLCAVAEVTDPAWAEAVETLLGARREAFLVERDQVRAAVRRIRRQRSDFWGCTIVQVMGTERFAGNPPSGSLAEMVQTSDPRARAFVNQRLGGIRRVETEAELEGAERAVAPDCQYAAGGGIQNRRPVDRLILGRRYDATDVDRLTAERDQAASAHQAAAGLLRVISSVQARLRDLAEALHAIPDIGAGLKSRRAANDELDLAAIAIADLEQALPVELEQAVAAAKHDLTEYEADLESAREARISNEKALVRAETTLETHRRDFNAADAAVTALPATPPERSEAARMLEEWLAGRHTATSISEQATREADVAAADAKSCLIAARRALMNYWQHYNETSLAAASTSAANGIEPRHQRHDVGMAITIFDEAFTRLDDGNIGNILDLLRQLGLQMLVAAPTSKRFAVKSLPIPTPFRVQS